MDHETPDERQSFQIVAVERDLRKRGRYLIYTGQEEGPVLSVHEDTLVRYRLFKGQSLTASELSAVKADDLQQSAYAMAIAYLGVKPRTRKEVERYLQRKELEPDLINRISERLETERNVDDREYAKLFAQQRLKNQSKGRRAIKQELLQRGVSKTDAAEAIFQLDEETELAAAVRAGKKKWPYIKGEIKDRRRKLMQFLLRKGYPGAIVKEAVKRVAIDDPIDEDVQTLDN